jgi:hypothetical protein
VNPKHYKKENKEFEGLVDKHLGVRSPSRANNYLLLACLLCSELLYLTFKHAAQAAHNTPGHLSLPFQNTSWTILMFVLCAGAGASGVRVFVFASAHWQRIFALILLIFPTGFLFSVAVWLMKRSL